MCVVLFPDANQLQTVTVAKHNAVLHFAALHHTRQGVLPQIVER